MTGQPLRVLGCWGLLVLGAPAVAFAQDTEGQSLTPSTVLATSQAGFGSLAWGADYQSVVRAHPELKKRYPSSVVQKTLRAGQVAVLDASVTFKGKKGPGRLYIDTQGGLSRVTVELTLPDEPGQDLEKLLDPLTGDLPAPDEDLPDTRVWKGPETVVTVTRTRLVGQWRIDLSFHRRSTWRPDSAGGSLGID